MNSINCISARLYNSRSNFISMKTWCTKNQLTTNKKVRRIFVSFESKLQPLSADAIYHLFFQKYCYHILSQARTWSASVWPAPWSRWGAQCRILTTDVLSAALAQPKPSSVNYVLQKPQCLLSSLNVIIRCMFPKTNTGCPQTRIFY